MNKKLNIGQCIDRFIIDKILKDNHTDIDRYLAHDSGGMKVMLQLFDSNALERSEYVLYEFDEGNLQNSPLFLPVFQTGEVTLEDRQYNYLVRQYVEGESLADRIAEHGCYSWDEAMKVVRPIIKGMNLLDKKRDGYIIHNDITCKNIILQACEGADEKVFLVSTNHLSQYCMGEVTFATEDLDPWYRAPETYKGLYAVESDVFSLGVVLYTMLSGKEPWRVEIPQEATRSEIRKIVAEARRSTPVVELIKDLHLESWQAELLGSVLSLYSWDRFEYFDDFERSIEDKVLVKRRTMMQNYERTRKGDDSDDSVQKSTPNLCKGVDEPEEISKGGFADVAGMEEVKRILRNEVMYVMKNSDRLREYNITPPNGMLLYGPPGCGKTFIAEKFAQESGMNYMMVNGSDLGGTYVHETQCKIAQLFKDAQKRAPVILCFDELDGMVSSRDDSSNKSRNEEVAEFLCQLNNCGERGIFVIGTTNYPQLIDSAILRTGRLDKLVYIPAPDKEARRGLIEFEMRNRKREGSFDYDALAEASKDCVSSDISCMVNDVALEAAMSNMPINQQQLLAKFKTGRRSVQKSELQRFNRIHNQMGGGRNGAHSKKIGYKPEW